jgi:hypothetical protein
MKNVNSDNKMKKNTTIPKSYIIIVETGKINIP